MGVGTSVNYSAKVLTFSRPRYVRIVRKDSIAMRTLAQKSSDCFDRNTELLYNPSNSFTLNLTFSACGRKTHSRSRHLSLQPPFFDAPGKSVGCGVDGGLSTSSPSLLAAAELEFAAMTAALFLAQRWSQADCQYAVRTGYTADWWYVHGELHRKYLVYGGSRKLRCLNKRNCEIASCQLSHKKLIIFTKTIDSDIIQKLKE